MTESNETDLSPENSEVRDLSEVNHLIWDVDNTIWDWVKMHSLGMEAMASYLSESLGISQEDAEAQLKGGYERQVLLDFGNVIQAIPAVRGSIKDLLKEGPTEEGMLNYTNWITSLVTGSRDAYSEIRGANFTLFPGAAEIMKANKERGGRNFVYTDSPLYKALERLGRLNIGPYIDYVWAAEDPRIDQTPNAVRRRVERFNKIPILGDVSKQKKPNVDFSELLNVSREYVQTHVGVIGDSKDKDMWLAHKNKCHGFHAEYGLPSDEDMDRLRRFAPEDQQKARETGVSKEEVAEIMKSDRIIPIKSLQELASYLRLNIGKAVKG